MANGEQNKTHTIAMALKSNASVFVRVSGDCSRRRYRENDLREIPITVPHPRLRIPITRREDIAFSNPEGGFPGEAYTKGEGVIFV